MSTRAGMRIAELAKRSSTSKETIHFYLREGLLKKPKKTSKNMAYYDESHLEQLRLIKRLRTESYLPLQVIKRVLKQGKLASSTRQLDLAGELFGQGARAEFEPPTAAELAERTGVDPARLLAYEEAGLIRALPGKGPKRYGYEDVRLAETIAAVEKEAGAGNEALTLERLALVERHMRALVNDELAHFFSRVLSEGDPNRALELLRGGRDTMGRYLTLSRARRLRLEVEAMVPSLERSIESAPEEPFFLPISAELRRRHQEPRRQEELLQALEGRPKDPALLIPALSHLLYLGDTTALLARWEQLGLDPLADPQLLTIYAEALLLSERSAEAYQLLSRARDNNPEREPLREAIWGAAVFIRIRDHYAELESSHELIAHLTQAFAAFDQARRGAQLPAFERARILLILGRVLGATPEFLGARAQGIADLEGVLAIVQTIRSVEGAAVYFGALERLELNALHVLSTLAESPAERAAYQAALETL